jgi:hypothetical protein
LPDDKTYVPALADMLPKIGEYVRVVGSLDRLRPAVEFLNEGRGEGAARFPLSFLLRRWCILYGRRLRALLRLLLLLALRIIALTHHTHPGSGMKTGQKIAGLILLLFHHLSPAAHLDYHPALDVITPRNRRPSAAEAAEALPDQWHLISRPVRISADSE